MSYMNLNKHLYPQSFYKLEKYLLTSHMSIDTYLQASKVICITPWFFLTYFFKSFIPFHHMLYNYYQYLHITLIV